MKLISVIICTYNPNLDFLHRVLDALKQQTCSPEFWELIIVDNASTIPLSDVINVDWKSKARIVVQNKPGLANARFKGSQEANGEWIVFVDDDNVLDYDYLKQVQLIIEGNNQIGIFGGKALPDFLGIKPPNWLNEFYGILALKDYGVTSFVSDYHITQNKLPPQFQYPSFAPAGAGMCVLKKVFDAYCQLAKIDPLRSNLGRKGKNMASGEDNDIILEIIKQGYQVAYFPQLVLIHIIPVNRMKVDYMAKLNFAMNISWIQVLTIHGICPWSPIPGWSIPLRQAKAWFTYTAWKSEASLIKWRGACGLFYALGKR